MKTKEIIFDMDGTITDLYAVPNWLEMLRAENPEPYIIAKPMYDMDTLNTIVSMLRDSGYTIKVVSWGSLDSSADFLEKTAIAKRQWLSKYGFKADEICIVPYGTDKAECATIDSTLIDDSEAVRETFLQSATSLLKRRAIDATTNICSQLVDLLISNYK